MLNKILSKLLGLGKLEFLSNVDKDKLTTWLGLIEGAAAVGITYAATGFDPQNPLSWAGLVYAIFKYVQGWSQNKI